MKKPGSQDYFDGKKKGEPAPKEQARPDSNKRRWWDYRGSECANSIGSTVDALQKAQAARIQQQVINHSLYGNRRLSGTQAAARLRLLAQQAGRAALLTYNAVQSIIDTGTSKVGETKPRPYFLTSGGNYKQQRKAKRLNKYTEGVFYENKTYDLTPQMFRDCAIDGDGFIFVFERGGKIKHEPVSGLELWVDEEEAQYGKPRNIHRNQVVDRDELAGYFSDNKAAVEAIKSVARASDSVRGETVSDMVSVVTSWHLGSVQPDGTMKGGKYAMALLGGQGFMLVEPEDWEHDFFPFARMPWCPPPTGCGYWSQGLAEQLQGEQIELNKELQLIQRSMQLAGTLIWRNKVGSKVVKESINNEIGNIINYAGDTAPEPFCPQPIHPVFFENAQRIIERMYRKSGWSEMSASSVKPPGLNSGIAQREFLDNESDRQRYTQRQYDAAHMQLAEITVALAIEAAAAGRLEAVRAPGRQSFDTVNFSDDLKGLKRSEFTLHCYSVNRLPKDPAGRLETVQEYIQAGIWSLRRGKKLLDDPDIETEETLDNAQETIIQKTLDAIVDDGDYAPPEPTDDLTLAKEMALQYIQHYRALDLEEERMDMLRDWNQQVDELMTVALGPAPMAPGVNPPQAAPEPPPTSDMIPNAPGMAAA